MFEALSSRLNGVFDKLRRRGALTETDVSEALREVRVALLEADVALPVVRDLIRCRSRQETEAFSTPSSNHRIETSPPKSTALIFVGSRIQAMRRISPRQKPSGSCSAASAMAWRFAASTWARAAISGLTAIRASSGMVWSPWCGSLVGL